MCRSADGDGRWSAYVWMGEDKMLMLDAARRDGME